MPLNLHLLRIFAAVAEAASFSRAAETLYISQPAVSKAVQELERQTRLALLDRSGRGVVLTDAGRLLNDYARQIFLTERAAEEALVQMRGLERGRLTIGASSTIGIYLLPLTLGAFHQRYPGIQLFLDVGNTAQVVERLCTQPMDIAFVEGPVSAPDIEQTAWRDDTLVVIAPPTHPLADVRPVSLALLLDEPFVLREPGSGTRDVIEEALHARGVTLRVAMELGSTEAIKQAVRGGLGLAIVSHATISAEREAGRLVVLDAPALTLRRTLLQLRVVGRPPSPALRAFSAFAGTSE